jgi:type II secretion system protein C
MLIILAMLGSYVYAADRAKQPNNVASFSAQNPRYRLVGTIVKNNEMQSYAIIRDMNTQKDKIYKMGQTINGYYVAKIKRGQVLVLREGKLFSLNLPLGGGAEFITVVSEKERMVNRTAFSNRYKNLNEALTAGFAFPYVEKGKIIGLKILRINDKKLSELSGMKEGDIVLSVNERKVANINQALGIYNDFKNDSELKMKVKRNNKILTYTYYMNWEEGDSNSPKVF